MDLLHETMSDMATQLSNDMDNIIKEYIDYIGVSIKELLDGDKKELERGIKANGVEQLKYKGKVFLKIHPVEIKNTDMNIMTMTRNIEKLW